MTGSRMLLSAVSLCVLSVAAAGSVMAAPSGGSSISEPAPKETINVQESFSDGVQALQNGDYKLAEKKFSDVLRVSSDHAEANYYMGLAKVGREKEKSSVRYFKRAIKERNNFVEAREQLALVYVGLEKTADAEEQLAALREIKENCTEETCDADYRDRTDRAIAKVEAALSGASEVSSLPSGGANNAMLAQTDPARADMRYGEAVRLINQSRYAEAIEKLYDVQAIVGPHPDILNYLGYSHRKLGAFDKAKSYYAAALKLNPDHLGATEYLGELYLELGEIGKAKEQLARLEALCDFGCAEREDLARLIDIRESTRTAAVE